MTRRNANTYLSRIYLDKSGYTYGTGYYYGIGHALYTWLYDDGQTIKDGELRAFDRDDAKAQVREYLRLYGLTPIFFR